VPTGPAGPPRYFEVKTKLRLIFPAELTRSGVPVHTLVSMKSNAPVATMRYRDFRFCFWRREAQTQATPGLHSQFIDVLRRRVA
jgi:hypothetical protein